MTTSGAKRTPNFTDGVADVNGVSLHYVASGKGPLMMFLHGFPEFWYAWKSQLSEFGQDHLAVALDMRGYNLSDKPTDVEQYDLWHLVEDVAGLARHLGYEKFTLVGHDWGGVVAWAFAIAHPEQLEKLVIINAPHPGVFTRLLRDDHAQQRASQYMLMLQGEKAEEVLAADNFAFLDKLLVAQGIEDGYFTEQDRAAYLKAWSQPGALTGALNFYRASKIGPIGEGARRGEPSGFFSFPMSKLTVKVPTLVVWGEKDIALVTRNLDGLAQCVPDLTIKRFPEASHWVVHEKPAEVNEAIREFVAG
jgi:pimeloyl-ACP methyl ester carboxylesterase